MGVSRKISIFGVFVLSVFLIGAYAGEKHEINKTFAASKTVKLAMVSGDCSIHPGKAKEIVLSVIYTYPPEKYEVEVDEKDGVLNLREKFKGSVSGDSQWVLTVPADTAITLGSASGDAEIKGLNGPLSLKSASGDMECGDITGNVTVSTASGDLELKNIVGEISVATASGDIEGRNLNGKMTFKTASGDMELHDMTGSLEVKTASGDVELESFDVKGDSVFKTASGEIEVKLKETAEHNLTMITVSGNIALDYNGKPLKGKYEFSTRKKSGDIVAPVAFQKTESTEEEEHGHVFTIKSFSVNGDTPKILMKTISGTIELKK